MMFEVGIMRHLVSTYFFAANRRKLRGRETTKHKRISEEMHTDLSFISNAHGKEQLMVKNVVWRKKCMKMY